MKPKILIWLLLVSGILLLALGCGQKSESKNSALVQTAPAAASPATPANSAAQSVTAPAAAGEPVAPDLSPLTQALHIYMYQHKKMPNTFAELVTAGYVKKIPPLPPGKKFVISPTTAQIIMVNQ